jgi:putative membrane protein
MMHGWNDAWRHGAYALGFPWAGLVMSTVLIALVVFVFFAFIRTVRTGKAGGDPRERGLEILIERFSRGEIDTEQFRSMKAELDSKS